MLRTPFVYLAQINSIACDLKGNAIQILQAAREAKQAGAALCLTPALSLSGWPLKSWLGQPDFLKALEKARQDLAEALAKEAPGVTVVVGAPAVESGKRFNAIYAFKDGSCLLRHDKKVLVEDEAGIFDGANQCSVIELEGVKLGIAFADDLQQEDSWHEFKRQGVQIVCASDSSAYLRGISEKRREYLRQACARDAMSLVVVNRAGAIDDRIYEGSSFTADGLGRLTTSLAAFKADAAAVEGGCLLGTSAPEIKPTRSEFETLFDALVCAVRDYAGKNGFSDALLGLSGGADSALVAAIAVEALGREHVHAVMMPTRYTSDLSLRLARTCAENLGIDYRIRPIGAIYDAAASLLAEDFAGTKTGIAEENLQARSRGVTLMALSNKFGWLTLATGNKSEGSTGYCTLYGDTVGGYAPIKDVFKTDVWELMRTYNRMKGREVIPQEIITRPPSAELKEGQTDEAALMPYERLDTILRALLESAEGMEELTQKGIAREEVRRVLQLLYRSEYKRRQCPVGPKISCSRLSTEVAFPLTSFPSFL